MKTVIITGGCGFIGSHVVEHFFRKTEWRIIILDRLSYASKGFSRIRSMGILDSNRIRLFTYDLTQPISQGLALEIGNDIHHIFHIAAETHVDNSIDTPVPFVMNNISSTLTMLEFARLLPGLETFFYFSTDEVFGSAPNNVAFHEWDVHRPTNPYSASKSAGEQLCIAYENTYRVPIMIVNCMNAFGERQHAEKFIPKVIKYVMEGKTLPIHADKECANPGSRFYIHARNIASALLFLIHHGTVGEKYNIRGEQEVNNLEMAQLIADVIQKPLHYELVNFHEDRPGHDLRYCLDGTKLHDLGFQLPVDFEHSLRKTVEWTLEHQEWLKK